MIHCYIRLSGMKRCGNHAVIQWLLSQMQGTVCFRNNVRNHRALGNRGCDPIEALRTGPRKAVRLDSLEAKDWFLCSFEDHDPAEVFAPGLEERYSAFLRQPVRRYVHGIVLRDVFNYAASRLRSEMNGAMQGDLKIGLPGERRRLFELWKAHARCFLDYQRNGRADQLAISYNAWLLDSEYRQALCRRLGIALLDDDSRHVVTGWGGGSSFCGMKRDSDEAYIERWRQFVDHEALREALMDDELMALNQTIFGESPLEQLKQILAREAA